MIVVMVMMAVRRSGLRIERRIECRDMRAEAAQHVFQNVITAQADVISHNLNVGVAIAEMPGEPHGIERAMRTDFKQLFRRTLHKHNRAVFEHEAVAIAQGYRRREVEHELCALLSGQDDAAAIAVTGVEGDTVMR